MSKIRLSSPFFVLVQLLLFIPTVKAESQQTLTGIEGIVIDAENGDTLPFVQIYFVGTTIGTTSDMEGHFKISNTNGYITVAFQMVGYKTILRTLKPNQYAKEQVIALQNDTYGLQDLIVTPKRTKQKYKRKNNPAVELIKNVIAHKDSNRIESQEQYKTECYEKLTMSLDKMDIDYQKNKWLNDFQFIQEYIDTTQFNGTPLLTVSLRETLAEDYFQSHPLQSKRHVKAKRLQGVDYVLDKEGLGTSIDAMFTPINIFDNDIELMLNRFVSPLSSSLAVSYYQYYIMDTLYIDGDKCIDLAFVPVNSESYGFTGHLYVLCDSTYALRKYSINVPAHINMNFVSTLSIEQEFTQLPSGIWAPKEIHTYTRFSLFKKMRQLYAHHSRNFLSYDFSPFQLDSIFPSSSGKEIKDENAEKFTSAQWSEMRPIELSGKEAFIDSLLPELRRIPRFNATIRTFETLFSGYLATSNDRRKSVFDFGPIYNTISYNQLEGVRLRIGGMTTANLSKHWFMSGYLAFGCKDVRLKYDANLIYSLNAKEYHPYESLRNALYFNIQSDVVVPGQSYSVFDRDNILMSFNVGAPLRAMQYVTRLRLRYEKEWENRLSINATIEQEHNEAAGTLHYQRINADGSWSEIPYFNSTNLSLQLRFAPGEPLYNNRLGKNSPFNLAKDAPVISLTHTIGYMDRFLYNRTDISAEKRFWLSSFGHIDTRIQTGIVWNQVPFPKLIIPESNQSFFLSPNSFNMMQPMEFIMDQYIALYATYYLKGWVFNRIPGWNKLKLREVISFSGIYGGLSSKNDPSLSHTGLYRLVSDSSPLGKIPYLEMTVGIENILKFIRIDYVRRLTYNDGLSFGQKNGIRLTFRFTL